MRDEERKASREKTRLNAEHGFVLLRPAKRKHGAINLVTPGIPDEWTSVLAPPALPPGNIQVIDLPWSGAQGLRKAKDRIGVVPAGDYFGELIVDETLAHQIGHIDGVTQRPTSLADKKGVFAEGYVIFDVDARMPLHRQTSDAVFTKGWLCELRRAGWPSNQRLPTMFRLLELPGHLFVERSLAERIVAAAPKQVVIDAYDETVRPLTPPYALEKMKALPNGARAEEAFWSLLGTQRSAHNPGTREAALSHPYWAFAVARCLDGEPEEATREAACRDALCAALYAKEVERKPHARTRAAAGEGGFAALLYATYVDFAIDPSWPDKICEEAGHNESSLAKLAQDLAPIAAFVDGEAALQPGPTTTQPRTWREHDQARYATSAKRAKNPTHKELDAAVKSDIDAFIERGLARLELAHDAAPEAVAMAIYSFVERVRTGDVKVAGKKQKTESQMELGCAWGEQLHRALGWQWANVATDQGSGIALVSPDRALAHYPFAFIAGQLTRKASANTILLLFNMIADGITPASKKGSYASVG